MKYRELFKNDCINRLNTFFGTKIIIEDETVNNSIDVQSMLERAGYSIAYEPCNHSFIEHKTITINSDDVVTRQRFILARHLGLLVNNNNEVLANMFASQLLMPKPLIVDYVKQFINERNYNKHALNEAQVDEMINNVANRLQVSEGALQNRMPHLDLLQPVNS